jgi:hypothetical protein
VEQWNHRFALAPSPTVKSYHDCAFAALGPKAWVRFLCSLHASRIRSWARGARPRLTNNSVDNLSTGLKRDEGQTEASSGQDEGGRSYGESIVARRTHRLGTLRTEAEDSKPMPFQREVKPSSSHCCNVAEAGRVILRLGSGFGKLDPILEASAARSVWLIPYCACAVGIR